MAGTGAASRSGKPPITEQQDNRAVVPEDHTEESHHINPGLQTFKRERNITSKRYKPVLGVCYHLPPISVLTGTDPIPRSSQPAGRGTQGNRPTLSSVVVMDKHRVQWGNAQRRGNHKPTGLGCEGGKGSEKTSWRE